MKTIFFTLSLLLVCSISTAQVLIEDPIHGVVANKRVELLQNGQPVVVVDTDGSHAYESSSFFVDNIPFGAGGHTATSAAPTSIISSGTWLNSTQWQGAFEFDLGAVDLTGLTTNNFSANLKGLMGAPFPTNASISLSIDIYDMADSQEDLVIDTDDWSSAETALSITVDPYINGDFDASGINVTEQLRADLFGSDTSGASTGFILVASGSTGFVRFADIANAYIEVNLLNDTDSESDSSTGSSITDTDSSTGSTVIPGTDSGSAADTNSESGTDDSDYWDTVDSNNPGSKGTGGSTAKCDCTTAGASTSISIWSLLF